MTTERTTSTIAGQGYTGLRCSHCDTSYSSCTRDLFGTKGRACCSVCANTDTHDQQVLDKPDLIYQEFTEEQFARAVASVVKRLRDLADQTEREGAEIRASVVVPEAPYAATVQRIVHAMIWGVANTNLDQIVTAAAAADLARQKGRAEA